MRFRHVSILTVAIVAFCGRGLVADDNRPVSFRHDVMPVLSKAGCNAGTCHGNASGKGGFQLSLRGQDPDDDYRVLTRALSNRRIDRLKPERSLILLKPTMQVAHEGGRRFERTSPEYRILHRWISAGAPRDRKSLPTLTALAVSPVEKIVVEPVTSVSLKVTAKFSDGGARDVTRLACYEPAEPIVNVTPEGLVRRLKPGEVTIAVRFLNRQVPVRLAFIPNRPDFEWSGPQPANDIDRLVFAKLKSLRINPSPVVGDSIFLRRIYLDLLGLPPTAKEAREFTADKRDNKRALLVDRLLKRPEHADFWAQKWADLLRVEEKTLDRKGVQGFYAWIRHSVATNKPLDRFVRELIASRGSTYKQPPANYYRAMRKPLMRAESTAQLFLGIRLQCAKCHNHPFDRWTQDDYYGWANNFARVKYKIVKNKRRDKNDKHEFNGEQIVYMAKSGEVPNPRRGRPTPPRFLGESEAVKGAKGDRLQRLAEWLTRKNNDQFARSQVNRIWYHLMGRGIVDPIDDFRVTNPPANPALLDWLTAEFVKRKFDVRHIIRLIVTSKTYQLASEPNETNRGDQRNFSHAQVRRLSAEQLLDSITQLTGTSAKFNGYPAGTRAGQIPGVRAVRLRDKSPSRGDHFLKLFGKPPRLQSCECERSEESTLSQTFQLVSGPLLNELLTANKGTIDRLLAAKMSDAGRIDTLYWSALSRPPSTREAAGLVDYLQRANDRRRAMEDIVWGLANSSEFLFRR